MDIKELKKELSKVSGIDFFNPKYRAIFKKFAGDDADDIEEAKAADTQTDAAVVDKADEVVDDITENRADDAQSNEPDYSETNKDETELVETIEENKEADAEVQEKEAQAEADQSTAEEARLKEITDDGEVDSESDLDETEETAADPDIATEEEAVLPAADMSDELLTTKLELELVRAGVREDRLDTAKRLFMPEFKSSGGNVQQIRELIAQYPEWIGNKGGAQGFGMPLGDKADALTNEEKALKKMGIDPRN